MPTGTIGLYSSLPIAWNETGDIRDALADDAAPHWALAALRQRGRVVPLDTLADGAGAMPLPAGAVLVLAQPRALTPQENVALDNWARAGGRVLLFVDPMLTAESRFAPGDPRRPQDIAMLSPILARWGLLLEFDEAQPAGERKVRVPEGAFPVNLAGRFRHLGGKVGKAGDVAARCVIEVSGLIADCVAGKGRIVAIADAALLESPGNPEKIAPRQALLGRLLDRLAQNRPTGR